MTEKTKWSEKLIENLLSFMLNNHSDFLKAKRSHKVPEFYQKAADAINLKEGKKVEDFLKNIGKEYRQVVVGMSRSGVATEDANLKLRGTETIFRLYDEYQSVFYPKGSAIRPQLLLTPGSIQTFSSSNSKQQSAAGSSATAKTLPMVLVNSPDHADSDMPDSPVPSSSTCWPGLVEFAERAKLTESAGGAARVARELFGKKRPMVQLQGDKEKSGVAGAGKKMAKTSFLESSVDYQQQYVEAIKEQNGILTKMLQEISAFRPAYQAVNGVVQAEDITFESSPTF